MNNGSVIGKGDVQVMGAGTGVFTVKSIETKTDRSCFANLGRTESSKSQTTLRTKILQNKHQRVNRDSLTRPSRATSLAFSGYMVLYWKNANRPIIGLST